MKRIYAKQNLGMDQKDIPDTALYTKIGQKMSLIQTDPWHRAAHEAVQEHKGNTMGLFPQQIDRSHMTAWQQLNMPLKEFPEAPKDLPDLPDMGLNNPALVGGVYNAVKPLIEGLETPLGVITLGTGAELKAASAEFPLAKHALTAMSGLFAGWMAGAYGAYSWAILAAP